jgi:hypothetical protein
LKFWLVFIRISEKSRCGRDCRPAVDDSSGAKSAHVLGSNRASSRVWAETALHSNGLCMVRIVHRASRFVHAAAARKFPPGAEKSSEIPERAALVQPWWLDQRARGGEIRRGSLASTIWRVRAAPPESPGSTLAPASPEPSTRTPWEASRHPLSRPPDTRARIPTVSWTTRKHG